MTQIIASFAEISDNYDAAFVDLWGCMHNGIEAYADAIAAMQAFRAKGGVVVLVTNAPRPHGPISEQIDRLGIPRDAWDAMATSGDSARAAMFTGAVGEKVYFIGEPHDQSFFAPMQLIENPTNIEQVPLAEADGIVCCGPFDPFADPAVNRPDFLIAREKGLKLLCANPDIIVDRGEEREWCAGALAALYTEMGGESLYFGKPHPPIYDLARRRMAALGHDVETARFIAIGDGIRTDVLGAIGEGIDSLFITGGLAAEETGTTDQPDETKLQAFVAEQQLSPTYAIGYLR
jgi:HAD superfamily hydrolase (TIGR01459 family)